MALAARRKTERDLIRDLEASQVEGIKRAEPIRVKREVALPFSIRLSAPLLKSLGEIAAQEHRTRGNLIQHILWDYVRGRGAKRA